MFDLTEIRRAGLCVAAAAALAGCSAATTADTADTTAADVAALNDQSCTPDSVSGDWTRLTKGNVALDAVWHLEPDGAIMCEGSDCARAAGMPKTFTLTPEGILITFERGRMTGECSVKDADLLMGGGVEGGGFSFVRK